MSTSDIDYFIARNLVWPYRKEWGEQRQGVIDYLKKEWLVWRKKSGLYTCPMPTDLNNVTKEARLVLKWWWEVKCRQATELNMEQWPEEFGTTLLVYYRDSLKADANDNTAPGPRVPID